MPDKDRSTRIANLTRPRAPTARLAEVWPVLAVMLLILGGLGGYALWSGARERDEAASATDAGLDKPSAAECAIAEAAMDAAHGAGADARWAARAGGGEFALRPHTGIVNPVDIPGYSDDEADNLRGKGEGDWRGCVGMGAFVRRLGWAPLGGDADAPQLGLGRPALNTAGDEAKVYETFAPPAGDGEGPRPKSQHWLETLHKSRSGARWQVTASTNLAAAAK